MSCVIGMKKSNGGLVVGGDGLLSDADSQATLATPKVFECGEFLYGAVGSLRNSQILQYNFSAPLIPKTWDTMRYICELWVGSFRKAVTIGQSLTVKDEIASLEETSQVLIGLRGELFEVQSDFSVFSPERPYLTIGAGQPYVLGALDAFTRHTRLSPRRMVQVALEIAASHCPSVGPPYTLIESSCL